MLNNCGKAYLIQKLSGNKVTNSVSNGMWFFSILKGTISKMFLVSSSHLGSL